MVYEKITPAEAKERLQSGENILLLDVRMPDEYARKHIPKSISMPLNTLPKEVSNVIPNKASTIFVYCQSGARSKNAAQILLKLGYTDVYDIGGIVNWSYEIE